MYSTKIKINSLISSLGKQNNKLGELPIKFLIRP